MSDTIVEVRNLSFRYMASDEWVLKDINLTINRGEFVGIIGPSGAGKTTLCYCLKGLIPHTISGKMRGEINICGMNTKKYTPAQLSERVAMVLQDPEAQIIGLTVIEDLAFGPENLEWPRERILAKASPLLQKVRLTGLENRETYSLSGGQKQRLAIAGALMMEPELLILDEPTSELDPVGREEVFATIRRLRDEKSITVIVVEQAVEELVEVCDRLIIMRAGEVIGDDTPGQLFQRKDIFARDNEGEIPVPQVVELLHMLEEAGHIALNSVTPYEKEAIGVLSTLLERC
ncbi:ABC transporter ATP-binding protein [Moorellaceae bacterium AZ2]